jgi:tetrapyrrole methylase family protein/MazG family protein
MGVESIRRLEKIMEQLRGEGGCPWDREQTHSSLRPYVIEEAYEVVEAIDLNDRDKLREELGDLLLQVVFHAQIAREASWFTLDEVIDGICNKLIRRHPHVFADARVNDVSGVLDNWQRIKRAEKGLNEDTYVPSLSGVMKGLPSLQRAEMVQAKARKTGFDWPTINGPLGKVHEELSELIEAWEEHSTKLAEGQSEHLEEEFGDLLFSLVNVARFLGIHPENALNRTTDKFIRRFHQMEEMAINNGKSLSDMNLDQMDNLWEKVKEGE